MQDTRLTTRPSRKQQGGFTIIEVMVGAMVLSVAIAGLAQSTVSASRLHRVQTERLTMIRVIEEELRAVEATPYDQIAAQHHQRGFAVMNDDGQQQMLQPVTGDLDGLCGQVLVQAAQPLNDANVLLEITVRIDWVSGSGPRTMTRLLRISRMGSS